MRAMRGQRVETNSLEYVAILPLLPTRHSPLENCEQQAASIDSKPLPYSICERNLANALYRSRSDK